MSRTTPRFVTRLALAAAAVIAAGCAGRAPAPEPGASQGTPPDLRGSRVMVLPVQDGAAVQGDIDAEIGFALGDRGEGVTWVLPGRLQEAVDRSPGLGARVRGLPVGIFSSAEVRRVGDPLYGDLRRLGSLVDADAALIPVRAWVAPGEGGERILLSAALIQVRTGRVLWFGVVEGDVREPGDPGALASAVERLARTLLWYVPGDRNTATTG